MNYGTGNTKLTHLPASKPKVFIWIICPEVIDAWQVLIVCFLLDLLHEEKLTGKKRQFFRSYILKKL